MQIENDDIKKLYRDILLLNIIVFVALVLIGLVTTALSKNSTINAAKIAEITQKTDVECATKTNTLFGIQKITIVK